MTKKSNNRIFLSYAHENLEMVRKIYTGLKERKLDVWFDKEDLGPGSWKKQIEKAIPKCRYFVICISEAALEKTGNEPGFQDDELQQAYEIARVQPEDSFTIVPVRLEDCGRGDHRLSSWQQYDLFNDFESELDHLAVGLGGISLADKLAEDTRTEEEKIIDSLFGKASTFYYAGEYIRSIDVYVSILALKPDLAEAWNHKGNALSALGHHDEAVSAYDQALKIRPDYAEAWNNKGAALNDLGRHDEALSACEKAIWINPGETAAWYNMGIALSSLNRHEEALKAYEKIIQIRPGDDIAWYSKAAELFYLGQKKEAGKTYVNALNINLQISKKKISLIESGKVQPNFHDLQSSLNRYNKVLNSISKSMTVYSLLAKR